MIRLPSNLTPIPKYPGYFWDVKDSLLYSIKIGGVLRVLKPQKLDLRVFGMSKSKMSTVLKHGEEYYAISHKGYRRYLLKRDLKKLTLVNHVIPKEKTR